MKPSILLEWIDNVYIDDCVFTHARLEKVCGGIGLRRYLLVVDMDGWESTALRPPEV